MLRALFQETNINMLCISESSFKKHHSDKSVSKTGYKLVAKTPDVSSVNFFFVEVSFHGQTVLVGSIYDPPRVDEVPIYWPVLEDLVSRYPYNILLGDFNIDLLSGSQWSNDFVSELDGIALTVVSKESTHFEATVTSDY
jgi:hypothetical protein